MKCVLSRFTKILTILFILPTQMGCCSRNTIISLMARDPNFRHHPCYIQWKADEDAKLDRILAEKEKLERNMAEYNRVSEENRKQEQKNVEENSYIQTSKKEIKKESSVWKVLGIIAGVIVGMFCLAACISIENHEITDNLQSNINTGVSRAVSPRSILPNNTERDQPTSNVLLTNLTSSSWQTETYIPLLPREVIKRQDSLPTYDDP